MSSPSPRSLPAGGSLLLAAMPVLSYLALSPAYGSLASSITPYIWPNHPVFAWNSLTPSRDFVFHPCYNGHECARLQVPLDWNATSPWDGDIVSLAVIRLPARVPIHDPRYGGPVFIVPGGPGVSGVDFLRKASSSFQVIVDGSTAAPDECSTDDEPSNKYFDLLALDPRGVMRSTPFHTCYNGSRQALVWDSALAAMVPGDPVYPFEHMLARQKAVADSCYYDSVTNPNGSRISSHMSTPAVVRDYVEVAEQYGRWREAQARRAGLGADYPTLSRLIWQKGEEKIRMWAMSYGAVIGATLAAAQPHRVESFFLDGNADTDEYYSGDWSGKLVDSDALLSKFFTYCAMSDDCPLKQGSETETELRARVLSIRDQLYERPMPLIATENNGPDVATWSDLMNSIWALSYIPVRNWHVLARLLHSLHAEGGSAVASRKQTMNPTKLLRKELAFCPRIDPYNPDCAPVGFNARHAWRAVVCGDVDPALGMTDPSREAFFEQYDRMVRRSEWLGPGWSWLRFVCLDWKGRQSWRLQHRIEASPAKPMLFAGNSRDLVTPLSNARSMAARFAGSGLLELDFEGHCSIALPSLCAAKAIRSYFQSGMMPHGGPCLPAKRPLLSDSIARRHGLVEVFPNGLSRDESLLLAASEKLRDTLP